MPENINNTNENFSAVGVVSTNESSSNETNELLREIKDIVGQILAKEDNKNITPVVEAPVITDDIQESIQNEVKPAEEEKVDFIGAENTVVNPIDEQTTEVFNSAELVPDPSEEPKKEETIVEEAPVIDVSAEEKLEETAGFNPIRVDELEPETVKEIQPEIPVNQPIFEDEASKVSVETPVAPVKAPVIPTAGNITSIEDLLAEQTVSEPVASVQVQPVNTVSEGMINNTVDNLTTAENEASKVSIETPVQPQPVNPVLGETENNTVDNLAAAENTTQNNKITKVTDLYPKDLIVKSDGKQRIFVKEELSKTLVNSIAA